MPSKKIIVTKHSGEPLLTYTRKNALYFYPGITKKAWDEALSLGEILPLPKAQRTTKWKRWYDVTTREYRFSLRDI